MVNLRKCAWLIPAIILSAAAALPALAQETPKLSGALEPFAPMLGVWRGTAEGVDPEGAPFTLTQTERVGPMLDGDVIVVEGRGYDTAGAVQFNAFGIISPAAQGESYEMRAYTDGRAGTYEIVPTADGFFWTIPLPGNAKVRYTATIDGESWREVGDFIAPDGQSRRFFEMNLRRAGETGWPAGGAIAPE